MNASVHAKIEKYLSVVVTDTSPTTTHNWKHLWEGCVTAPGKKSNKSKKQTPGKIILLLICEAVLKKNCFNPLILQS